MKYTINKKNYRDFNCLEVNKRAGRAYFIPYTSPERLAGVDYRDERYHSDMVRVLSGDWDFRYYEKNTDIPDVFDTLSERFDQVKVPSTWQRTGYAPPVYINVAYEFTTMPPRLPKMMPAAVYHRRFDIKTTDKNYFIAFLGVIPCVDLYINGQYAGYSEGAHNTAEFDISPFVTEGDNDMLVVVHKWSNATFIECQDMFRENGIFRDVLLYEMPKVFINDYCIKTRLTDAGWALDADVMIEGAVRGYQTLFELKRHGKTILSKEITSAQTNKFTFDGLHVLEWSAELPELYEAFITLKNRNGTVEAVRVPVGFKRVEIEGCVFKFNGANIKIKGVNHHDTHPVTGYVMSFDDLEKDVRLMKQLNVNAIRTSHYPPDPHLLMLCDRYGLYVVDEADIEAHGVCLSPYYNINLISNSKKWIPRYVDRVSRMFYRDRSHPCVIMWSLGNEAGGWKCQDACYEFLRANSTLPVHYEGASRTPRRAYDVYSEMYTHVDDLVKIKNGTRGPEYKTRPFYLCEYVHAVGVGPGAFEEYWQIFYSSDIFMGGCVWEWADHAVYDEKAPYRYTYGGDHGEKLHDGNFCVDGLMYPDRTSHTGALAMKAVYRPVRARYDAERGCFVFLNTNRFRSADYLTVRWEIQLNGVKASQGSIALDAKPQGEQTCNIPLPEAGNKDLTVTFAYLDAQGCCVASEQILLSQGAFAVYSQEKGPVGFEENSKEIKAVFDGGSVSFDKVTGNICGFTSRGRDLMNFNPVEQTGLRPNIFRALLDNDRRMQKAWLDAGYDRCVCVLKDIRAQKLGSCLSVGVKWAVQCNGKEAFEAGVEYLINGKGEIKVEASLKPSVKTETRLPRFGLAMELPAQMSEVEYYGLGEAENLPDFKEQCLLGIYRANVSDMHEPYIKPQDNGNHSMTRWLRVGKPDGPGLLFLAQGAPFSFSVHNYTQTLLQNAKHREDVYDQNTTALCIDGFVRGTGTSACGPDTLEPYIVDAKEGLRFEFMVKPL